MLLSQVAHSLVEEKTPQRAVWRRHSWGYSKVLWAQNTERVNADCLKLCRGRGDSWEIGFIGYEPSEKALG